MRARDFEEKFWDTEGIVIVLRCPENEEVGDYDYERAAAGDTTLSELKRGRLSTLEVSYVIHDGDAEVPNGRTKLSTIRNSYN